MGVKLLIHSNSKKDSNKVSLVQQLENKILVSKNSYFFKARSIVFKRQHMCGKNNHHTIFKRVEKLVIKCHVKKTSKLKPKYYFFEYLTFPTTQMFSLVYNYSCKVLSLHLFLDIPGHTTIHS